MFTTSNRPPHAGEGALPPAHATRDGLFDYRRIVRDGNDPHETLAARVNKALHRGYDPLFGERAHMDVLVPDAAPGEYMALAHLLDRHDATQPPFEPRARMELTITLADDEPLHRSWERARSFARRYFCAERSLAALMVLSSPYAEARSATILLLVPARRLGVNGFAALAAELFADTADECCRDRWLRFRQG